MKKVIRKSKLMTDENLRYAQRESSIHEMLSNHNNVVKLYDKNETENEFQMYMEYCDKADSLTQKIREVSKKSTDDYRKSNFCNCAKFYYA